MINIFLRKAHFLTLLCILFLLSCSDSSSVHLLKQASQCAENEPKQALALLDSIQNPETLSEDHYMQYIVTKVHAKYKNYKDIAGDTLIFTAQKYFDAENNIEQTKLAHFYAGSVYYEQQNTDKALECYLKAEIFASLEGDNLFAGKIQNNIGYIYFEQSVYDTAIDRFHQALNYFDKAEGSDTYKLQTIHSIATAYNRLNHLDSARFYYSNGLKLAEQINNQEYQANFKHKLGFICRTMGNYKQSYTYLHDALTHTTASEDSLRVYLSLARLYNKTNQSDSVKFYTDIMTHRLSEITYNNTLRSMYDELSKYNEQCGNYKEAMYYTNLKSELSVKIIESNSADKLIGAKIQFLKYSDKKEAEIFWKNFAIIVILIIATIFFIYYRKKKNLDIKTEQEKFTLEIQIQKQEELMKISKLELRTKRQLEVRKENFFEMQTQLIQQNADSAVFLLDIQQNFITDWKIIEKKLEIFNNDKKTVLTPQLREKVNASISIIKTKAEKKLYEWAKQSVQLLIGGDRIVSVLDDKEFLLLILCFNGYSDIEISSILNVNMHSVLPSKIELKNKLRSIRIPMVRCNEMIFPVK